MSKEKTDELRKYMLHSSDPKSVDADHILKLCQEGADITQLGTPQNPFSLGHYLLNSPSEKLNNLDLYWFMNVFSPGDPTQAQSGPLITREFDESIKKNVAPKAKFFILMMAMGGKPNLRNLIHDTDPITRCMQLMCCRQHGTYQKEDWEHLVSSIHRKGYTLNTKTKALIESFSKDPGSPQKYYDLDLSRMRAAKTKEELSVLTFDAYIQLRVSAITHCIEPPHPVKKQEVIDHIKKLSPKERGVIIEHCLKQGSPLYEFFTKHSTPFAKGLTKSLRALEEMKAELDGNKDTQVTSTTTYGALGVDTQDYKKRGLFGNNENEADEQRWNNELL